MKGYGTLDRVQACIGKGDFKAMSCMRTISERKRFILESESKKNKVIELLLNNHGKRIVVFFESVKVLERTIRAFQDEAPRDFVNDQGELERVKMPSKYYGEMPKKFKEAEIERFISGDISLLFTVRALDEGFNVPNIDMAIIHSGNSQKRQFTQRVGRVLRKSEGKEKPKVYQIYVKDTIDEKYMKDRSATDRKPSDKKSKLFWWKK